MATKKKTGRKKIPTETVRKILQAVARFPTTGADARMTAAESGVPIDECRKVLAALALGQGERPPYTRAYAGRYFLTPAGATAANHDRHPIPDPPPEPEDKGERGEPTPRE